MLHFFRKKHSSLKWVWWVLIFVLGAGMLLLFVNPPTGMTTVAGGNIAMVGDCTVDAVQFRRQYNLLYQSYSQQFGEQFETFREQLRLHDQAVNALITECAVSYEAERLGLGVTAPEIQKLIRDYPAFQEEGGGFIGVTRYQQILESNGITVQDFEDSVRRQVLRQKLQALVSDGVLASPEDVRRDFAKRNQQTRVKYVAFNSTELEYEISPEDRQKFFEEQIAVYQIPERRSVQFAEVLSDTSAIELSEEEVAERMLQVPQVERVRVSQILFKTPPNQDDPIAKEKADDVLRQLKGGADFAQIARRVSEDDSAPNGGDLGFISQGTMDPDFERVAFSLQPGELSDVVKTPFGYHIIKVTSAPRTPDQSRKMLAEYALRQEKAAEAARERAGSLLARLRNGETFEEIGKESGVRIGTVPAFGLGDTVTDISVRSDFNQQAFALQKDEFIEPYASSRGSVIGQVAGIERTRSPALEDVKEKVEEDYRRIKNEVLADEIADTFFRSARDASSLDSAAEADSLKVTETDFFKGGDDVDETLKFSPLLHERVVWMNPGDISPPIKVTDNLIVFEVVEKTEFDAEAFAAEQESILARLKQERQSRFFGNYLQKVMDQLRQDQELVINQEMVNAIAGIS